MSTWASESCFGRSNSAGKLHYREIKVFQKSGFPATLKTLAKNISVDIETLDTPLGRNAPPYSDLLVKIADGENEWSNLDENSTFRTQVYRSRGARLAAGVPLHAYYSSSITALRVTSSSWAGVG